MPLNRAEFLFRRRFKRRSTILLLDAACLLGWTNVREVAELAEVSERRAGLELAELVAGGWLVREERGAKNGRRQVRFRAKLGVIAGDHPGVIAGDQGGVIAGDRSPPYRSHARARAPDPDLSLDPGSMEQRVRPSGGIQGGDGRTDGGFEGSDPEAELRNSLVLAVAARWQLSPRIVTPGIQRLLNARATERELQAFLRDAERGSHPAFDGVGEENRFGRSCTEARFEIWRRSRARAPAPAIVDAPPRPRRAVNSISTKEMEDFVRKNLRR